MSVPSHVRLILLQVGNDAQDKYSELQQICFDNSHHIPQVINNFRTKHSTKRNNKTQIPSVVQFPRSSATLTPFPHGPLSKGETKPTQTKKKKLFQQFMTPSRIELHPSTTFWPFNTATFSCTCLGATHHHVWFSAIYGRHRCTFFIVWGATPRRLELLRRGFQQLIKYTTRIWIVLGDQVV